MFKRVIIATAVVLAVGTVGVASADIPDSETGEFTACVQDVTGNARLIDKQGGASCLAGEAEKSWSATAPSYTTREVKYTIVNLGTPPWSHTEVSCLPGERAVSGGWFNVNTNDSLMPKFRENRPSAGGSSWVFSGVWPVSFQGNTGHPNYDLYFYAVCAS